MRNELELAPGSIPNDSFGHQPDLSTDQNRNGHDSTLHPTKQYKKQMDEAQAVYEEGQERIIRSVAPDSLEVHPNFVVTDGHTYQRTVAFSRFPARVRFGWSREISQQPGITAMGVYPFEDTDAARMIGIDTAQTESAIKARENERRIKDPNLMERLKHLTRLGNELASNQSRIFSVTFLKRLIGESREELENQTLDLRSLVERLGAQFEIPYWRQLQALRTSSGLGIDELHSLHNLPTSALSTMAFFDRRAVMMELGLLWGVTETEPKSPLLVDVLNPEFTNPNGIVIAETGGGKTTFLEIMALRNNYNGLPVWIVDPSKETRNEYLPACIMAGGRYYKFGPGSPLRLNLCEMLPYDPADLENTNPYKKTTQNLRESLEYLFFANDEDRKHFNAGESTVLLRAADKMYSAAGIKETEPEKYAEQPMPNLTDLRAQLLKIARDMIADEFLKKESGMDEATFRQYAGELATKITSLLSDPSGELFSGDTNFKFDRSFVVCDLGDVDKAFKPIVYSLVNQTMWREILRGEKRERMVICDEAPDNLTLQVGRTMMRTMAMQSRRNWTSFWTAGQRRGSYTASPEGTDLANTPFMKVYLAQNDLGLAELQEIHDFDEGELQYLQGKITDLNFSRKRHDRRREKQVEDPNSVEEGNKRKGRGIAFFGTGGYGGVRVPFRIMRSPIDRYLTSSSARENVKVPEDFWFNNEEIDLNEHLQAPEKLLRIL